MGSEADYRLPRNVTPHHYDITLEPDLMSARFEGTVAIEMHVHEPTTTVTLNAAELEIAHAEVRNAAGEVEAAAVVELDSEHERVVLTLGERLPNGQYRLVMEFTGLLNDRLRGFYRSAYTDASGVEHVIATTQFEATDARRAFPCWDEPDLKATFDISLVVPEGLRAVSCSPIVAEEPLPGGARRVQFGTTMKLSTYLVAFVVGRLEASSIVDVDGVPLRIIHVPGKAHLARFASEFGAFALRFFADYYGIPYPGDKVDLIAIPDFASGAMENLGAVTFRESVLLVDPETATQAELQRVADVVAHELAHMWFGDLVTMRWWNGLWLKEAFATFMEMVCVDAYRPEWRRWTSFALDRDRSMDTDGLRNTRPIEFPVASPSDADAMFDVITYSKGAAVLRMLQQYLGEDVFRRGINRYLHTHAYGNAETSDLWAALEAESGEPVGDIMTSWIFQGGHPRVEVSPAEGGVLLRQERFQWLGSGAETWRVPVLYAASDEVGRLLLDHEQLVPVERLRLNRGGQGYYRTTYGPELLDELAAGIRALSVDDRFVMVADAWAAALAGDADVVGFLELAQSMRDEPSVEVWSAILGGLRELDRVISSDGRPGFEAFVRTLLGGAVARVGWTPHEAESDLDRRFRGVVLQGMGVLGQDQETMSTARSISGDVLAGAGGLDGEIVAAAIAIDAASGDVELYSRLVAAFEAAENPQAIVRYLHAMAAVPVEATAIETFDMVLDGRIRSQNATAVVARLIANRMAGPVVWAAVENRWDDLIAVLPPFAARQILAFVHLRSEPDLAPDIAEWVRAHPLPGGEAYAAQQLERLEVRVGLRTRTAGLSFDHGPGRVAAVTPGSDVGGFTG